MLLLWMCPLASGQACGGEHTQRLSMPYQKRPCRAEGTEHQNRKWCVLTEQRLHHHPVGGGVSLRLPLGAQACHPHLVGAQVGHAQVRCREVTHTHTHTVSFYPPPPTETESSGRTVRVLSAEASARQRRRFHSHAAELRPPPGIPPAPCR